MKKVISAFTLGALIFGTAYADISLGVNYRNGTNFVKTTNAGSHDYKESFTGSSTDDVTIAGDKTTTTWLDQTGYQKGTDTVQLSLKSDVIDVTAKLQPSAKDGTDDIVFNELSSALKFGSLKINAGWMKDGFDPTKLRVKPNASNWEGGHFETFKPGNMFTKTVGYFICDLSNIAGTNDYTPVLAATYKLGGEKVSLTAEGNVIFDRSVAKHDALTTSASSTTENSKRTYDVYYGAYGYGAFAEFAVKDVFALDFITKGNRRLWAAESSKDGTDTTSKKYGYGAAYGLYFKPQFSKAFDATIGGETGWFDGNLADWSVDVRFSIKSGNLTITSLNNYSQVRWSNGVEYITSKEAARNDNLGRTGYKAETLDEVALSGSLVNSTKFKGRDAMWNFIGASYKINDTFTGCLNVGAISVFHTFHNKYYNPGVQVCVTPGVQIFAAPKASVIVGFSNTWTGIAGNNDRDEQVRNNNLFGEDPDYCFSIPVLFRVQM